MTQTIIPWDKRYSAIRKVQGRYLFLLLLFGLFFLVLQIQSKSNIFLDSDNLLTMPVFGLTIEPKFVTIIGPTVLFLLLLSILGSIDAAERALKAINVDDPKLREAYDDHPNIINLALDWGSIRSRLVPKWLRWNPWVKFLRFLTIISLPAWLTLFYVEANLLLYGLFKYRTENTIDIFFVIIGVLFSLSSAYRLIELYILRLIEFKNIET